MERSNRSPFLSSTGIFRISSPVCFGVLILIGILAAFFVSCGMLPAVIMMIAPLALLYVILVFSFPVLGLYSAFVAGFFLIGIGRYIKGVQVGIGLDAIIVLTFISLVFRIFYDKSKWRAVVKDITLLSTVWFVYVVLQLFNPEARSVQAWFSGRGVGFYMFTLVPLTLMLLNSKPRLRAFLFLWGGLSILVTLKGIFQYIWGVDACEQAWLNEGNFTTHIIHGKLRVFSFLSDAGQFGAHQAYSAVVASIVALSEKRKRNKFFFILVAVLGFFGMFISGTRGAISVPFAGFALFVILRKNIVTLFAGIGFLIVLFVFFKFTTIGQGNYEIRRMRSAFDISDPSLQVRLENQRKFKEYLAVRPFGGGLGHAGGKAQRFTPNTFLANTPTDSWYVLIWAELGIVGLILHLLILLYILIKGSFLIMFRIEDSELKLKMTALACGMLGIMAASYGNMVLGQIPTSTLIYPSMAILLNSKEYDQFATGLNQKLVDNLRLI